MVAYVDNTNVNKKPGVNGFGSTTAATGGNTFADRLAKNSIFHPSFKPGNSGTPDKNSDSDSSSGGLIQQALTGTGTATSGSGKSDAASADAKGAVGETKGAVEKFMARARAAIGNMGRGEKNLTTLNKNGTTIEAETKSLTAERDQAADEVAATDSQGRTFDGTGIGEGSANNISGIGAHVMAAGRPGANGPAGPTTPPATSTSGSQGNSDAQARLDSLNSQLDGKMTQREQIEQKREKTVNTLKANYKAQITPLKAEGQRLDKQATDAEGKIKDAQSSQQKAGTVTAVGGTVTAAGSAMCATGYGASVGSYMVYVGGATTVAGGAWNMKAKSAEGSAKDEQTATKTAKTNLIGQEKLLVTSYTKAVNKARKAK